MSFEGRVATIRKTDIGNIEDFLPSNTLSIEHDEYDLYEADKVTYALKQREEKKDLLIVEELMSLVKEGVKWVGIGRER